MERLIVTVVDRAAMNASWGHGLFRVILRTVEIDRLCPKCLRPRGAPRKVSYHEDGEFYVVDRWDNPCGHIDLYPDVLKEGRTPQEEARELQPGPSAS